MMSSIPGYLEIKANTIHAIDKIRNFRRESGIPLAFTLDAGPNVHILYSDEDRDEVMDFVKRDLQPLCEDENWIDDEMGDGPKQLI